MVHLKLTKYGSKRFKTSTSVNTGLDAFASQELPMPESVAGGWEDLTWRPTSPPLGDEPPSSRPQPKRRSSLPTATLSAPASPPSTLRPPVARSHASSPLAQSISRADMSPKSRFKLPALLKRSKSTKDKLPTVKAKEKERPTSPPPALPSPPSTPSRPKLGLRVRTNSLSRFTRSKSVPGVEVEERPTSPVSPPLSDDETPFTLRSFRSVTSPVIPSSPTLPPTTRPVSYLTSRPSSSFLSDPLALPPTSPSISVSQFREARAARSSVSLHSFQSSASLQAMAAEDGPRITRPISRLDLPMPPPLAVTRTPLTFTPPASPAPLPPSRPDATRVTDTPLTSSPSSSRAPSPLPSPSLDATVQLKHATLPLPAFLSANDRRASLPSGAGIGQPKGSVSAPETVRMAAPERSASDSHTPQVAMTLRERAKHWTATAVQYAQERATAASAAHEAARRAEDDAVEACDAAVATDSERGSDSEDEEDDDESSYEDAKKAYERHAWNSAEAMQQRAEAQQQAYEASRRFNTSFSALPRHGTPAPMPPSIPPTPREADALRTSTVPAVLPQLPPATLAPAQPIQLSASSSEDDDDQPLTLVMNKRPMSSHARSHSVPLVSLIPPPPSAYSPRHSFEIESRRPPPTISASRLGRSSSKPPSVARPGQPRWRSTVSETSIGTLTSPNLSLNGSESTTSGLETPRTPPDAHDRMRSRDLERERAATKRASISTPPMGVDAALWQRLPIDQRVALQMRGEAFMAMLAQQAAAGYNSPVGQWEAASPASALGISGGGGGEARSDYFQPGVSREASSVLDFVREQRTPTPYHR